MAQQPGQLAQLQLLQPGKNTPKTEFATSACSVIIMHKFHIAHLCISTLSKPPVDLHTRHIYAHCRAGPLVTQIRVTRPQQPRPAADPPCRHQRLHQRHCSNQVNKALKPNHKTSPRRSAGTGIDDSAAQQPEYVIGSTVETTRGDCRHCSGDVQQHVCRHIWPHCSADGQSWPKRVWQPIMAVKGLASDHEITDSCFRPAEAVTSRPCQSPLHATNKTHDGAKWHSSDTKLEALTQSYSGSLG